MKKLLVIFTVGLASTSSCQPISQPVAARYTALGAYSRDNVDLFSTRGNPASLAQLPSAAAAVYSERRFMLNELSLYAASVGLPISRGGFGLHMDYFGSGLYNQMQLSLGYGLSVSEKVDVGAQFNYHSVKQGAGYGSSSSMNASVGALFHLTDKMHAGITIYNPLGSKWSKTESEKIPAQYRFGMGYDVSDKMYASGEVVKEEGLPAIVNLGLQYRFLDRFFARAGIASGTSSFFGGVGFKLTGFRIDFSASYHPQLGVSPGVLILFGFGKNKRDSARVAGPGQ